MVMQEHGLTEAATGDRHFEQAGFKALLVCPPFSIHENEISARVFGVPALDREFSWFARG